MGDLIRTFTYDRNVVRRTPLVSASAVAHAIDNVGVEADAKVDSNIRTALRTSFGIFRLVEGNPVTTALADAYMGLYRKQPVDAFRWLVTRFLWLYCIPNGTACGANQPAIAAGLRFSFFRSLVGLLMHLDANTGDDRYLYYGELCAVFQEDAHWSLSGNELYSLIGELRGKGTSLPHTRGLLDDLETEYEIPRDNLNGTMNKLFVQTGLFEYREAASKTVGIALRADLDGVMRARIRHVIDNPEVWDPSTDWSAYLELREADLPVEPTSLPQLPRHHSSSSLAGIVAAANADLRIAGLHFTEETLRRFVASLLTKRFVILTGLSGSGKTKLAQAFACWLTSPSVTMNTIFEPGESIPADRTTYRVLDASPTFLELVSEAGSETEGTQIALPMALVREWASCIVEHGFARETSPRSIRGVVAETTRYSAQLNSFESQLKAVAFRLLDRNALREGAAAYEVVAVGADWTSNERVLGYADALRDGHYVRTQALKLILRARASDEPHFLILDEMNLSHVERYFADMLSAMESGESISLHSTARGIDGVPCSLQLPANLFVIGTVNIDDTTYLFSPKVLDRANTLEFAVRESELSSFLGDPAVVDLSRIAGKGRSFADAFLEASELGVAQQAPPEPKLKAETQLFFRVLSDYGAEFGYRTAAEVARFLQCYRVLTTEGECFARAFDAQILQKMLPKLHGSQRQLEPLLFALAALCRAKHEYDSDGRLLNETRLEADAKAAALEMARATDGVDQMERVDQASGEPFFPLSYDKLLRMIRLLRRNGFASFAEA